MLSRGLTCALRLRSRALSASVPSNRPLNACPEAQSVPQGLSIMQSNAFSTSSVCGIFAAGGSLQQEGPSSQASSSKKARSIAATPPQLAYMHDARSIAAEQALVTRLANIWGMPPEVLASNVAMLSDLLKPCGRDTAAHALWVLVRCPALRHMTDQQVRHTVRGLHQRFPDIPKQAFKTTVYKHPWVLNAQLPTPQTAAAAAAVKDASSPVPEQQLTPWTQEVALMLLEMQTPSGGDSPEADVCKSDSNSTSMPRASMAGALAGVRLYVAAAEAQQLLNRGMAWAKGITTSRSKASTAVDRATVGAKAAATPSAAAGPIKPTPPSPVAEAVDSMEYLTPTLQHPYTQHQQVNRSRELQQQLQQLLYQCPKLTVLPPAVLASRWQLLLSVLLGQVDSAAAVARTNPYLMVTGYGFADKPQGGGSGGCGGGGLSDWDYSQLAGLV